MQQIATATENLATASGVRVYAVVNGQNAHADGALVTRGQFLNRSDVHLGADIELASSFIKHLLDGPALPLMLLAVFFPTFLVAVPNALAPVTLLESIAFLSARRTQLLGRGGGPIFRGGFAGITILIPPFLCRSAERYGAELLLNSLRCIALFG